MKRYLVGKDGALVEVPVEDEERSELPRLIDPSLAIIVNPKPKDDAPGLYL